jgi:hypothetical protein
MAVSMVSNCRREDPSPRKRRKRLNAASVDRLQRGTKAFENKSVLMPPRILPKPDPELDKIRLSPEVRLVLQSDDHDGRSSR